MAYLWNEILVYFWIETNTRLRWHEYDFEIFSYAPIVRKSPPIIFFKLFLYEKVI